MINYSSLPDAKKPGSAIKDVLAISAIFLLIFGGALGVTNFRGFMDFVNQYGGFALGFLAIVMIGFYALVFSISLRNASTQRTILRNFAQTNGWLYAEFADRKTLPQGLPAGAYRNVASLVPQLSTPPALTVEGALNSQKFMLVYARIDPSAAYTRTTALLLPIAMPWAKYSTFIGRVNTNGAWEFVEHDGFILNQTAMEALLTAI